MTTITIEKIAAEAVIGVEDWERVKPIPLLATLSVTYDAGAAEQNDNVADTVDYAALTRTAVDFIRASSFRLLETLAAKVAELVLNRFPSAESVTVSLCKPGILPEAAAVWVTTEKKRQ